MSEQQIPFTSPRDRFYEGAAAGVTALIVEDDLRTAFALTALLQRGMMTIVTAESGSVALEILDQRADIAIILMDIMMPVMNGYETMSAIRQRPQATELPIIAVTGKAAGGERQRCIAAGATDYVSMPIDTAVLLTAISDCLLATSSRDAQSAASAPCEPQPTAIASVPADTAHTTPFPFPFPDSLKRYATSSNPLRNRRALNRSSTAIGSTSLTDQPSGPSPAP